MNTVDFKNWATQDLGLKLDYGLEVQGFPGKGLGLVTKANIAPGKQVLQLPVDSLLCVQNASPEVRQLVHSAILVVSLISCNALACFFLLYLTRCNPC